MPVTGFHIEQLDDKRFAYRKKISSHTHYKWHIMFKHSDLYVACNKDILNPLIKHLSAFYKAIEAAAAHDPAFVKSFSPVRKNQAYSPIINEMIAKTALFGVGPMASVAGAVCDYIGRKLMGQCRTLIIENGGDVFIKSDHDVTAGAYTVTKDLSDKLKLKISYKQTPCGLCSSSGTFGHSISLGKSDLATVLGSTTMVADAAATALANRIAESEDIQAAIDALKGHNGIRGLLAIKDKKVGIWGQITLAG